MEIWIYSIKEYYATCGKGRLYHFKLFKGCFPQILFGPFLNTLTQMFLIIHVVNRSRLMQFPEYLNCLFKKKRSILAATRTFYAWNILRSIFPSKPPPNVNKTLLLIVLIKSFSPIKTKIYLFITHIGRNFIPENARYQILRIFPKEVLVSEFWQIYVRTKTYFLR